MNDRYPIRIQQRIGRHYNGGNQQQGEDDRYLDRQHGSFSGCYEMGHGGSGYSNSDDLPFILGAIAMSTGFLYMVITMSMMMEMPRKKRDLPPIFLHPRRSGKFNFLKAISATSNTSASDDDGKSWEAGLPDAMFEVDPGDHEGDGSSVLGCPLFMIQTTPKDFISTFLLNKVETEQENERFRFSKQMIVRNEPSKITFSEWINSDGAGRWKKFSFINYVNDKLLEYFRNIENKDDTLEHKQFMDIIHQNFEDLDESFFVENYDTSMEDHQRITENKSRMKQKRTKSDIAEILQTVGDEMHEASKTFEETKKDDTLTTSCTQKYVRCLRNIFKNLFNKEHVNSLQDVMHLGKLHLIRILMKSDEWSGETFWPNMMRISEFRRYRFCTSMTERCEAELRFKNRVITEYYEDE